MRPNKGSQPAVAGHPLVEEQIKWIRHLIWNGYHEHHSKYGISARFCEPAHDVDLNLLCIRTDERRFGLASSSCLLVTQARV